MAQKSGVKLPTMNPENLSKYLIIGKKRGTLEEYLDRFDITLSVLQSPENLKRAAYELVEDISEENIRYI